MDVFWFVDCLSVRDLLPGKDLLNPKYCSRIYERRQKNPDGADGLYKTARKRKTLIQLQKLYGSCRIIIVNYRMREKCTVEFIP